MGEIEHKTHDLQRAMLRNIRLFGVYKVFTKRVFLPLTTIYASQQAGLTVSQIGLVAALSAICSLCTDTISGFWADKHGRKRSARIGSMFAVIGTLFFVVGMGFWSIAAGSVLLSIGYSFLNGSMEALVHDSLVALGRESDYAKVASRAQSVSLVANAGIVALVPLLYPINKRLPFVLGVAAYTLLFFVISRITEPPVQDKNHSFRLVSDVRQLVARSGLLPYVCIGFAFAAGTGLTDLLNLGIVELGLKPQYYGLLFSVSSLLGAAVGWYIHVLKRLSFQAFAALDILITAAQMAAYGFVRSLPIAALCFLLSLIMFRYQRIMYQHYILAMYGSSRYKATIISLMSNFESFHVIWLSFSAGIVANSIGVLDTLSLSSLLVLLFLPLLLFALSTMKKNITTRTS